jgi:PTS system cellobiose-specific IIB component
MTKNILLVCSGGMSSSVLVKRMQKAADDQGIDTHIWAVADVRSTEAAKEADVILIGPQIRFLLNKMKERVDGKPVAVIDMMQYGQMNGEKVLEQALALLPE